MLENSSHGTKTESTMYGSQQSLMHDKNLKQAQLDSQTGSKE